MVLFLKKELLAFVSQPFPWWRSGLSQTKANPVKETAIRNARIDLLRGVAILLVLVHHFNIAYRLNDTILFWPAIHALARNGNYGVTMFFVISGYLITSNAQRRWGNLATLSPRMFYTLRFARIAPPLLLLLAVVNLAAIAGVPIFESRTETGAPFPMWIVNLASLTFWMNVLIAHAGWINYPLGVLWSLSVEETFYATFPLICLLLRREKHLVLFWLVLVVMAPLYRLTHQGDEAQCLYAYAACSDAIAIGCITALIVRDGRLQILQTAWIQAATIAAMVTLYAAASIAETNVLGVTAMALGTAICVIGAQSRHRPGPIGTWFGRLSYEHYLFHLIVLGALRTYFPPASTGGNEKLLIGAAYLLGTCALSASLSRFVTEPANRMLRGATL